MASENHLSAVVGNTDERWFRHFQESDDQLAVVDEVNFWRPASQSEFQSLPVGGPFFFRLKAPINAIAGFGFFAASARMTVAMAWEVFGDRNGDPNADRFQARIRGYRTRFSRAADATLACIILRGAVFLPKASWIPWGEDRDWRPNIVAYKRYDLDGDQGTLLKEALQWHQNPVPDLEPAFVPRLDDERLSVVAPRVQREGQGTFRVRLLQAYGGQCAVTGEHATPVLEAAHIVPYLGPHSNHPQNGLVLRSDLHRLYDAGYVTVTPDLRLEVSSRLKDEFENGRAYYDMAGRRVFVPENPATRPSAAALEWHADHVFR